MIIGLTGHAGSGKDEAAKALVALGWTRLAFADPMRAALLALDPYIRQANAPLSKVINTYGWDEAKRSYHEIRELLQRFGTEVGRNVHGEDCWIRIAMNEVADECIKGNDVVITDCRFDNEAEYVRKAGGVVVKIVRPGVGAVNEHASDAGVSEHLIDWQIFNGGRVEDLHTLIIAQATWRKSGAAERVAISA